MKKIFYLLFICSIAFASCHKHEHPIEITECTSCGGGSSSLLDTALVGHWKVSGYSCGGTDFNNDNIDLYIESDGSYTVLTSAATNFEDNYGIISQYSNNKIKVKLTASANQSHHIFNYSIQNGLLSLEDDISATNMNWFTLKNGEQNFGPNTANVGIINNLTKQ